VAAVQNARAGGAEPLDVSGVDHLFGFQLAIAAARARQVYQAHVGAPFDLRTVEFTVLMLLRTNRGTSPKRIAQTLNMPAPNVTVLLDRLAARKLVERRRSRVDGRALEVLLTADGEALAKRAHAASLAIEEPLLRRLSPGERVLLRELLQKLGSADQQG
jgi:DNA-binding MarR family transcriptional regulator